MITNEEKVFYKNNGFLILRRILPDELIQKIREDIHLIMKQQLATIGHQSRLQTNFENLLIDMEILHKQDIQKYLASVRLCAKLTSIYEAILNPKMLEVAHDLGIQLPVFQTQPVVHVMAEKLAIKDGYFGLGAHQDWPALQSGLDTFTTWVPFNSVGKGKYTLEIYPKSHLMGFCESVESQNIHEIPPGIYQDLELVQVEMNPGDVLFFSAFLIHKSELIGKPNELRMAYSMRYENASCANFIRRNYPGAQKRVVERTLDINDIPDKNEILKVFNS